MSHLLNTRQHFCHIAPEKHKPSALRNMSFIYLTPKMKTGTHIASTYIDRLLLTLLMYLCKHCNS